MALLEHIGHRQHLDVEGVARRQRVERLPQQLGRFRLEPLTEAQQLGLLFGTAAGTPIAIASATLGASLACLLSRTVAGDAIQELGGPRLIGLAAWISRRGFVSVLYARLAPGVPYNLVNYAAGMTAIPILVFAAATAIATAPRTFAYVALGGSFGNFGSPESIIAVAVLVAMGVGGLVAVRRDLRRERSRRASGPPLG